MKDKKTKFKIKLPEEQEGFCNVCFRKELVFKTSGLSGDAYDWLCDLCLEAVLEPVKEKGLTMKNCLSCNALLFGDEFYFGKPKKPAFCKMCVLPKILGVDKEKVGRYGSN